MELTSREAWTALHGMVFGAIFLLLFSGGFVAIWTLGSDGLTADAIRRQLRRLAIGGVVMVVFAWATVIVGSYWVYPWYRAKPPVGGALASYPKFLLISSEKTADWHEFGMEWKEHVAWLTPILLTAVLAIVVGHGQLLVRDAGVRRFVLFLLAIAFCCASIAGVLGAFIDKAAPVR